MRKLNTIKLLIILLGFFTLCPGIFAQRSSPYTTPPFTGHHTGNRVGISFHDDGQIAGFQSGIDIRGEWPFGSSENYIGDCIPLIGVEFINMENDTLHSVVISRGPRSHQSEERHPVLNYFWGWNPRPGFRNNNYESVGMSHLPDSWPVGGWNDPIARNWIDQEGKTQWFGYFGRGIINADQESVYEADDQWDDEFNFRNNDPNQPIFLPDRNDPSRHGMGLRMRVRGFQWSNFLAEDCIFWLYDITNEGTTIYRKADFGTVVGTLAGGDGDSQDDLGYFDVNDWITYSWDSDSRGNHGQKVGYVGYAFLESPGNPFDGIDNDNDSKSSSPEFVKADFDSTGKVYRTGDNVVLINPDTYERTLHPVTSGPDTVYSLGVRFVIVPGVTRFREGFIARVVNGVSNPHVSASDGIDNDLDGLIDENEAIHYTTRIQRGVNALKYINFVAGEGVNDPLIDERRDNSEDEDADWTAKFDDVGIDGLGPQDAGYPGMDLGEGNGVPDQGEPNFGRTDPDESDQIGLTGFNFFNQTASPDMRNDSLLWSRMTPGRFDIIPPIPQDGDFIYSSGFFPLVPANGNPDIKERFSVALLFGEDLKDIVGNKQIVQQIYNAGYKFPQPPAKPRINITQEDGKVVIYWDGKTSETSRDFITKRQDFQGYKIYRSTDATFTDSRSITNALGFMAFDNPIAQYDIVDSISGFYYPSKRLLSQIGGTTFYMGDNTGVVNKYIDENVVKGQTYYYAVAAYDAGDEALEIIPTENTKFIRRNPTGAIVADINTGFITPGSRPIGYTDAKFSEFQKSPNFRGTGNINIDMVDDAAIKNGFQYQIVFQDTSVTKNAVTWSLLDLQTPDTVVVRSTGERFIVNPTESIALPEGTDTILVNGSKFPVLGAQSYTAAYDSLVNMEKYFLGNTPITHGFRVTIDNNPLRIDTSKSGFKDVTISPVIGPKYNFQVLRDARNPRNNGIGKPSDYVVEFYNSNVTNSTADTLFPKNSSTNQFPSVPVNIKIKNITEDRYIDFAFKKTGNISTNYTILFREEMEGQIYRTWRVDISYIGINQPLPQSGTLNLYTQKPFSSTDVITFSVKQAEINNALAASDMDRIKVVPNPYVVTHEGEARLLSTQTRGRGEREIRFTHVPPGSKISIFTVRGELIRTLTHDDLYVGDVYWNLRTEENIDVAYGVYVYVVEAQNIGKKVGKFALIK